MNYINLHTHIIKENQGISILNVHNNLNMNEYGFNSFGIHPWDIQNIDVERELVKLNALIAEKKIFAVGEIGLDRAIEFSFERQKTVFIKQLEIAERAGIPIIIHCVRAYADFLQLHNQLKPSIPWIFHGFNGNAIQAKQIVDKGCYLSFGEQLFHQTKIQVAIKQIPLQKVFFETDTSEKPIEVIYAKACELLAMDLEQLKGIIEENFKTVFQY